MLQIAWDDYHNMVHVLNDKIAKTITPSEVDGKIHLVGLPRGGTLIALHLTYINEHCYAHFDGFDSEVDFASLSTVIVDDVLETGKTRVKLMNKLNISSINNFAVLVDKANLYGIPPADVSVMRLDSKIWIEFPYENVLDPKEITSRKERGYGHDE